MGGRRRNVRDVMGCLVIMGEPVAVVRHLCGLQGPMESVFGCPADHHHTTI